VLFSIFFKGVLSTKYKLSIDNEGSLYYFCLASFVLGYPFTWAQWK